MELQLLRLIDTGKSWPGKMSIDGIYQCCTLERSTSDTEYQPIPCGTFPVNLRFSDHFQRALPHIDNVPGRTAIEIHNGNWPQDSRGCVIVGTDAGLDCVENSVIALNALISKLQNTKEDITITVQETII